MTQPRPALHTFKLMPIRNYFTKSPLSESSINLIELEPGTFLDTEEDINVISAAIWVLCVEYERLNDKEKPKVRDDLRKWIMKTRMDAVSKLAGKVEPPFAAFNIDQMQKDVGIMMEEVLLKTLPSPADKKDVR
ncbi:MAG: hypothetical protein TREMPRED_001401 [Tremellales sp. Tagirdzhanova-0007]|nr:MAG: hypothetical protein TREMPRED_001401 [Tremellales sp. Tagirdzhanova-0007]